MNIAALNIQQSEPGIDLSDQPEGMSVQMSDPMKDFEHARNAVTMTFDLRGASMSSRGPGAETWRQPRCLRITLDVHVPVHNRRTQDATLKIPFPAFGRSRS